MQRCVRKTVRARRETEGLEKMLFACVFPTFLPSMVVSSSNRCYNSVITLSEVIVLTGVEQTKSFIQSVELHVRNPVKVKKEQNSCR